MHPLLPRHVVGYGNANWGHCLDPLGPVGECMDHDFAVGSAILAIHAGQVDGSDANVFVVVDEQEDMAGAHVAAVHDNLDTVAQDCLDRLPCVNQPHLLNGADHLFRTRRRILIVGAVRGEECHLQTLR